MAEAAAQSPTSAEIERAIKDIFAQFNNDLASLTGKRVRTMLEEKFSKSLIERKSEIDSILMRLIEELDDDDNNEEEDAESSSGEDEKAAGTSNGSLKRKATKQSPEAAKGDSDSGSDDAQMARKLQQKELGIRPRAAKAEPKKRRKTAKDSNGEKPKKRKSIYSEDCFLSEPLADVMGVHKMPRNQVVKRMWEIFRERDLFDPKNRQFVICDEQLLKVFKTEKIRAFGMMKYLKNHMTDERHATAAGYDV